MIATFAGALVFGCASGGQPNAASGHTVSGVVSGEATVAISVTLSNSSGSSVTTTGASGAFAFKNVSDGNYVVTASLSGYRFAPDGGRQVKVEGADVGAQNFFATATHHSIRGTVSGVTVAGIQIALSGASSGATTTAADGSFSFLDLIDGTYTLTPIYAGDGFSPGARTVTLSGADMVGQDFTATSAAASPHTIAGVVTGALGKAVSMTLQEAATGLAITVVTDASGAYAFQNLVDGAYTVTPALSGFLFVPRSLSITLNGADAQSQDFAASVLVVSPGGTIGNGGGGGGAGGGGGTGGGGTVVSPRVGELATGGHVAYGIAIGNDHNAWITDDLNGVVSQVILQDGVGQTRGDIMDIALAPTDAQPTAIALRYFGLRCLTETRANRIACMDASGDVVLTVDVPTPASGLIDIINGPGRTGLDPDMWFAEHDAGKIGRLSLGGSAGAPTGTIVEYLLPSGCKPTALTWGNDDNVWWAAEGCRRIGWITPTAGTVYAIDAEVGQPVSLAMNLGEAGVWFVDAASDRLGRLSSNGGVSWFSPTVPGSRLGAVTLGPDQALYVTEIAANAIARFPLASFDPNADPNAGRLTDEFPLPNAGAQPFRITSGTDGNVWFTERGYPKIGVVYMETHCIGGSVTLADRTPVAGVTVMLGSPDASQRATSTDSNGDFQVCGLPDGTYTLTPSAASRIFTPAMLTVVLSTANTFGRNFVSQ